MRLLFALSSAILLLVAGVSAQAESRAERQACENDAFRVCGAAIPDRHNVFLCLMANRRALSPACRTVMTQYSRPNYRSYGYRHYGAARRTVTTTGQGSYR